MPDWSNKMIFAKLHSLNPEHLTYMITYKRSTALLEVAANQEKIFVTCLAVSICGVSDLGPFSAVYCLRLVAILFMTT